MHVLEKMLPFKFREDAPEGSTIEVVLCQSFVHSLTAKCVATSIERTIVREDGGLDMAEVEIAECIRSLV